MLNDGITTLCVGLFAGCIVGWALGSSWGDAERERIIEELPEYREAFAILNTDLKAPTDRELVCDRIIDEVQGLLADEWYEPPSIAPLD